MSYEIGIDLQSESLIRDRKGNRQLKLTAMRVWGIGTKQQAKKSTR